ncbi:MAG TPA: sulfurtransferase TusA family protein [Ktedonobacterales bacterium]|nr:sulfurtransferase TusA family protein [Ktedonobacterales bacterium]
MATTYQVDKLVDAKGQSCPMPVVMLAKAFKDLTPGQILAISATDPGSKPDVTAWADKTGNTLLEMVEEQGVFTFYLQKA